MDFAHSPSAQDLRQRLEAFMQRYVLPYNAAWHASVQQGVYPPPFLEDLKVLGREEGLCSADRLLGAWRSTRPGCWCCRWRGCWTGRAPAVAPGGPRHELAQGRMRAGSTAAYFTTSEQMQAMPRIW